MITMVRGQCHMPYITNHCNGPYTVNRSMLTTLLWKMGADVHKLIELKFNLAYSSGSHEPRIIHQYQIRLVEIQFASFYCLFTLLIRV